MKSTDKTSVSILTNLSKQVPRR